MPLPVVGNRIKAGEINIRTNFTDTDYKAVSRVKVTGIVDWFVDYDLNIHAEGVITADGVRSRNYVSQNNDGGDNRRVSIQYLEDDVITEVIPEFGDLGDPEASLEQKLEATDPLSALINFTSKVYDPDNPCGDAIRAYDGKQRFNLELTYVGTEPMRTKGWQGHAVKCAVKYIELSGFEAKTPEEVAKMYADIKWAFLHLAVYENGLQAPIKLEARLKKYGKMTLVATRAELILHPETKNHPSRFGGTYNE